MTVRYRPVIGRSTSRGGRITVQSVRLRRISCSSTAVSAMTPRSSVSRAIDEICDRYDERELAVIADFLGRIAEAGAIASAELAGS